MTSNRQTALSWRNEVLVHLHQAGLHGARTEAGTTDINQPVAGNDATIGGMPWAIVTRAEVRLDLSEGVRRAEALADRQGKEFCATLVKRPGYEVADAYAVMPMSVFAKVLAITPTTVPKTARAST